jgi:butyryl-CoA dehydrogenase
MDLLGRKVPMKGGKAVMIFNALVNETILEAQSFDSTKPYADKLAKTQEKLVQITMHLLNVAQTETPEVFLRDATLYLEYFGHFTISWLWLKMSVASAKALALNPQGEEKNFHTSKLHTLRYYFEYELPKTKGIHERLMSADQLTLEVLPEELV